MNRLLLLVAAALAFAPPAFAQVLPTAGAAAAPPGGCGVVGPGCPLPMLQTGSTGTDYSANVGALPNIGAAFGSSSTSCPSYVLLKTIPAAAQGANRASVDVEDQSGAQICVVRDDGTAASGAAPSNGSLIVLAGGAAAGAQGGSYASTTFKGRLQIYAASASAQVSAFVE